MKLCINVRAHVTPAHRTPAVKAPNGEDVKREGRGKGKGESFPPSPSVPQQFSISDGGEEERYGRSFADANGHGFPLRKMKICSSLLFSSQDKSKS